MITSVMVWVMIVAWPMKAGAFVELGPYADLESCQRVQSAVSRGMATTGYINTGPYTQCVQVSKMMQGYVPSIGKEKK